jgi:hypothetical protein
VSRHKEARLRKKERKRERKKERKEGRKKEMHVTKLL